MRVFDTVMATCAVAFAGISVYLFRRLRLLEARLTSTAKLHLSALTTLQNTMDAVATEVVQLRPADPPPLRHVSRSRATCRFATATARSRATLEMQTDAQREAIRSAMAAEVEGFEGAFLDGVSRSTSWLPAVAGTDAPLFDGRPSGRAPWQVPMPAVVATATK